MPPPSDPPASGEPLPPNVHEMFVYLSEQVTDMAKDVRSGRTETAELRAEVMPHIKRLNRRVFGSKFPPDQEPPAAGELQIVLEVPPPLTSQVETQGSKIETQHETIATLQQEVSNVRSEVAETRAEVGVLRDINAQQSRAMGLAMPAAKLAKQARTYVTSRAGIRDIIALVMAIAGLVGVWRGLPASAPAAPSPPALTAAPR